ncbi:MAG: Mur ligase family protein [Methanosphaera sp.]|nr:Mur ligase family protein [Methanosphaera sp.]
MLKSKTIKASRLAKCVKGTLYGSDKNLKENYTYLNMASQGDIVIRHWIDPKGIQIANDKGVACLITQDPHFNAVEVAQDLDFTLIVTNHIEYATALALNHTVSSYADNSFKVAVTGTNGKSTTTHLLYTIFSEYGYSTYTNTDAESEGNTLIDPKIASELPIFYEQSDNNIDAIALEVSEVQGWQGRIMDNHAQQMIEALNPDSVIITNASMDHINLVKDFDHIVSEISGGAKALTNQDNPALLALNYDDENIRSMDKYVADNPNINVAYFGVYGDNKPLTVSYKENIGIFNGDNLYIEYENLPFQSKHFIQDIMAAILVCEYKGLDKTRVVDSISNYRPLERRFTKLCEDPVIIDDFAHNPSGIKLTIENGVSLGDKLYIVNAIRGSRGDSINKEIATALVEALEDMDNYTLILSCSSDVVNHLNTVLDSELRVFTSILDENNITYTLEDTLEKALMDAVGSANQSDVILLLGAQGMDPASSILRKNNIIN